MAAVRLPLHNRIDGHSRWWAIGAPTDINGYSNHDHTLVEVNSTRSTTTASDQYASFEETT
ncbi:MAG TPA: hypothetical protein VHX66_08060 [Solirubrobacteraceae bacterium]|nr:hypothetical protein [Solirubrobacteraceae bacterium]